MEDKDIALIEAYNCIRRCMTFLGNIRNPGSERELLFINSILDDLQEWDRKHGEAVKALEDE